MNTEANDDQPQTLPEEEFVAELLDDSNATSETPVASTVEPVATTIGYDPTILVPPKEPEVKLPPSPFSNLAAKGGAVGAVVLGVMSFAGSFITSYAILNSFLGIMLGLWGLSSNHRKMAVVGIVLCLVSAFFCVVEISAWLQTFWPSEEL